MTDLIDKKITDRLSYYFGAEVYVSMTQYYDSISELSFLYEKNDSLNQMAYEFDEIRFDTIYMYKYPDAKINEFGKENHADDIEYTFEQITQNPYNCADIFNEFIVYNNNKQVNILFERVYNLGKQRKIYKAALIDFILRRAVFNYMAYLNNINKYKIIGILLSNIKPFYYDISRDLKKQDIISTYYFVYKRVYFQILFLSSDRCLTNSPLKIIRKSSLYDVNIIRIICNFI